MHVAQQTPQELVVVDGTRWISAICVAAALVLLYFAVTRHQPKSLFVVAFFLLSATILDLRKTFTFDAMQRVVRWNGRTILKAESGEIPFDDILDIGTQTSNASSGASGRQVLTYRLTLVTSKATIPMSYAYSGQPDAYSTLRTQILGYIKSDRMVRSADQGSE